MTPDLRQPIPPVAGHSPRSRRRIGWDLVRAGCVVLVILYHSTFLSVVLHPELPSGSLVWRFQAGASLLLVLSAYFACITIRRGSLLRYWWGRMARLVPPFVAAVLLIYAVLRAFPVPGWWLPGPSDLVANLLMLSNWKPQLHPLIDPSHWTIPLQLMAFTLAALLYRSRWGHGRSMIAVLWAAVLIPIAQWPLRVSNPSETYRMLVDGFGLHRWHLFVVGAAIWLWSTRRIRTPHFAALFAVCMAAQVLHTSALTPAGLIIPWGQTIAVCTGLLVMAITARWPDWDRIVPSVAHRPIQWFAGVSYGVFLVHQSIGYLVMRRLNDIGWNATEETAAMLVTGVLLGWALTRVVERPAHRLLMQALDRVVAFVSTSRRDAPSEVAKTNEPLPAGSGVQDRVAEPALRNAGDSRSEYQPQALWKTHRGRSISRWRGSDRQDSPGAFRKALQKVDDDSASLTELNTR